jgi:hypothetical protein
MCEKFGCNSSDDLVPHDIELARQDAEHHIYLCQYNIIHVNWGEHSLVFCPGDFFGLPFLLATLNSQCHVECLRGAECPKGDEDSIVHLQYGSVQIPFTVQECHDLHMAIKEAVEHLFTLEYEGHFSHPKWLPSKLLTGNQKIALSTS